MILNILKNSKYYFKTNLVTAANTRDKTCSNELNAVVGYLIGVLCGIQAKKEKHKLLDLVLCLILNQTIKWSVYDIWFR